MTFDRIALIAVVVSVAAYGFVGHWAAAREGASVQLFPASSGVLAKDDRIVVGAFVVKENGEVRFCQGSMEAGSTPRPYLTCVPENQK